MRVLMEENEDKEILRQTEGYLQSLTLSVASSPPQFFFFKNSDENLEYSHLRKCNGESISENKMIF